MLFSGYLIMASYINVSLQPEHDNSICLTIAFVPFSTLRLIVSGNKVTNKHVYLTLKKSTYIFNLTHLLYLQYYEILRYY